MTLGQICWVIGGAILLLYGFNVIGGDVKWIVVAAGLGFFGVALMGIPFPTIIKQPQSQS